MTTQQRTLRQLITENLYAVDERDVAAAIVARASARTTVAHARFHSDGGRSPAQALRRSLHLERLPHLQHGGY